MSGTNGRNSSILIFLLFLCILVIIPATLAITEKSGYVKPDTFVKEREKEAEDAARAAYDPDPMKRAEEFNDEVVKDEERLDHNIARRKLKEHVNVKARVGESSST